jgi:type VI protein secretion system component VasF
LICVNNRDATPQAIAGSTAGIVIGMLALTVLVFWWVFRMGIIVAILAFWSALHSRENSPVRT